MGQPREVAGGRRQADADETDVVVRRAPAPPRRSSSRSPVAGHRRDLGRIATARARRSRPGTRRGRARWRPRRRRTRCRARSSRARRTAARRPARPRSRRPSTTAGRRRSGCVRGSASTISSTVTSDRLAREHRLLLHADDALEQHVAVAIGLLRVDDRDVGPMRRDGGEPLAGERAVDEPDVRVHRGRSDPTIAAEERRRHVRRAGGVGVRHRRVAVLFELERPRPAALDRIAQAVQRPDAGVAAPGEHQACFASPHPIIWS